MTMYNYVWLCMTMYNHFWLYMTMFDYMREKEREKKRLKRNDLFANFFTLSNFFKQFKLFYMIQIFSNFSYFSTNLDFVHLCILLFTFTYLCSLLFTFVHLCLTFFHLYLPLFKWCIYAQILCLFSYQKRFR